MRATELSKIRNIFFTPEDVSRKLGISYESARVSCSRYVQRDILLRIKRNFYALRQNWENLSEEKMFVIANVLQVLSYISLTTALSFYGFTTQIQRAFYESVSLKRTKEVTVEKTTFTFTKLDKKLYGGFVRKNGYFIATPEKAILDALYLSSLSRYNLDFAAVDFNKANKKKIKDMLKIYPEKVKDTWRKHVGSI